MLIVGVVIGSLIGYIALQSKTRGQSYPGQTEGEKSLQELKTKCDLAVQDLKREQEARIKDSDTAKNERDRLEEQLNLARTKGEQQAATAAHAQAMSSSAAEQVLDLVAERELARTELERFRERIQTLERELSAASARANESERSKEESVTALTSSHQRELQSIRIIHSNELDSLRLQSRQRETEKENEIAALKDTHERMQTVLRDAHAKELAAHQKTFDELKSYIEKADETLKVTFGDASTKALQEATKSFLELAQNRFREEQEGSSKRAENEKKEIERLLEPVQKELGDLEKLTHDMNKERAESFGVLKNTIENLSKTSDSLVNALKKPSVRGSWGEGQLISILESSGWQQGKNFDVQNSTEEDGKTLRTDVVVHLPRGRKIIIDSKAPLDQYMLAMETDDETEKTRRCQEHSKAVRGHMKSLEKKEYWLRYSESPPYVILFLPYEAAYQIACENDRSLLDDAHKSRIILANPMTLMNLVHLASYVLNEERMQQNTEEVRNHGKQLCDRLEKVLVLLGNHGRHVRIAAESYNDIVASVSSRLTPSANRMRELGAGTSAPLVVPDTVDTAIRHLIVPELPGLNDPEETLLDDLSRNALDG